MSNFMLSGVIVGVLLIIFYIPYLLAKGLTQICYDKKLTGAQQFKCICPIYNIFYADLTYWGKLHLPSWSFLFLVVVIIARVLQWRFAYNQDVIAQILIIGVWVALIIWYVCNMINSILIMKDSTVISMGKAIAFSIIFPFGYFYIGQYLVNVMLHALNQQEDRSWDIDDEGF